MKTRRVLKCSQLSPLGVKSRQLLPAFLITEQIAQLKRRILIRLIDRQNHSELLCRSLWIVQRNLRLSPSLMKRHEART